MFGHFRIKSFMKKLIRAINY